MSRPTLFTDTLNNTTQSHGYDPMNQVVSSEFSLWGTPKNYTYDLGGNLLSALENTNTGFLQTYETTSNRLATIGAQTNGVPGATQAVVHDPMGSVHSVGSDIITYDATGRLSEWNDGADTTKMYYNALGQRVKTIVTGLNAGVRLEAYDSQGRLMGVYTPNGTGGLDVVEELVHLDGWRTVATIRPHATLGMASPAAYPIVSDHLGSPRKILDPARNLMWSWTNTEPYGHQAPNELHSGNAFVYDGRFPGQRFDRSTGALHNGFRTYSPKLGRHIQSDPLGLLAGWNTYAYVGGAPTVFTDPFGLSQRDVERFKGQFNATVSKMTSEGVRHPNPEYNNRYGKWGDTWMKYVGMSTNPLAKWKGLGKEGNGYEVCVGQTLILGSDIAKIITPYRGTDDRWTMTNPHNGSHYWIELRSSNPSDPVIWMDPWDNKFSVGKPCPRCKN